MPSVGIGKNVYTRARERIESLYDTGDRLLLSFSGGKDSGIVLELMLEVARERGCLPVEAAFYDEEIIYPGTTDYVLSIMRRPEVDLRWVCNNKPQVNAFSRTSPYWWTFDPELDSSEWVRQPPQEAVWVEDQDIGTVTSTKAYPPPPGKRLIVLLGMRAGESMNRRMAVFASKGFLPMHPCKYGSYLAKPIFDWSDSDVWHAIHHFEWEYNRAYNVMHRLGVPKNRLRIAPPTMTPSAVGKLSMAAKAWPQWFDRVCRRLPGVRTAARYGKHAVRPHRRLNETWRECFIRTCIKDAPTWISERAQHYWEAKLRVHRYHSSSDIPDIVRCPQCVRCGSYRLMAYALYMGDPYSLKDNILPWVDADKFRPGSGKWYSKADEKKEAETRT